MIFRRIKSHVVKEDWFAVFIDFLIVVFGVFMAFQISKMNQERVNAQKEEQFIERLANDLKGMSDAFRSNDVTALRIHEGWVQAFRALEKCEANEAHSDAINYAFSQYQRGFPPPIQRATFDEMQSTGAFSRLSDTELKNSLALLYSQLEGEMTIILGGRENQLAAGRIMWKYIAFSFQEEESYTSDFDTWGMAAFNPLNHCDNLELRGAIWEMVDTNRDWLNSSRRYVDQVDQIVSHLEQGK